MHQIPGTNCQDLSKEGSSQPHKLSCWLADRGPPAFRQRKKWVLGEQSSLISCRVLSLSWNSSAPAVVLSKIKVPPKSPTGILRKWVSWIPRSNSKVKPINRDFAILRMLERWKDDTKWTQALFLFSWLNITAQGVWWGLRIVKRFS